jgi:hypothetical protein
MRGGQGRECVCGRMVVRWEKGVVGGEGVCVCVEKGKGGSKWLKWRARRVCVGVEAIPPNGLTHPTHPPTQTLKTPTHSRMHPPSVPYAWKGRQTTQNTIQARHIPKMANAPTPTHLACHTPEKGGAWPSTRARRPRW